MSLCDYYLWETLKDTAYVNYTNSLHTLKDNTEKINCQYLKTRALSCAEKYFQPVQGLLTSHRAALPYSPMKSGVLKCRGNMGYKLLEEGGLIYGKAPINAQNGD